MRQEITGIKTQSVRRGRVKGMKRHQLSKSAEEKISCSIGRQKEQNLWLLHPGAPSILRAPFIHGVPLTHGLNGRNQDKCPIAAGIQWSQWPGSLLLDN